MDKLAFVKTLEAILAAVVAVSLYNFLQTYSSGQVEAFTRPPDTLLNDFLDNIDLNSVVNEYDYLTLDSLFSNLFYETIYYYFEPVYHEKLLVSGDNGSPRNISFIYHFPLGVDKNSVRVFSSNYELNTNALFNWRRVPLNFNESISDEHLKFNITIDEQGVNNQSLRFFIRGKESVLSITDWVEGPSTINASIISYIPELASGELCYVYYSTGLLNNASYPLLSESKEAQATIYNSQEARTADVLFSAESLGSETSTYHVKYSLFSENPDNYAEITNINNTGVTLEIKEDEIKGGSAPYSATIRGENAVKRVLPIDNGFVELTVYGGYS
ncbi:hypothetical protein GF352_00540 [archaeon]|nr:hypothetical protein [archaeon]